MRRTATAPIGFPLRLLALACALAVAPACVSPDAGGSRRAATPAGPTPEEAAEAASLRAAALGRAAEQVVASSRSEDPFLRANALEAAQSTPQRAVPLVQLGLDDAHPAVRFAALATIGKLKLKALAPAAARLVNDPSESVRAAALFALQRNGRAADLSPLAAMLASPEPGTRANAALLLGMLGDLSAAEMLKDVARTPMPRAVGVESALFRIQVAEAVVRLGDDSGLDALRAGAYSDHPGVQVLAFQMLGRVHDRRMERPMAELLGRRGREEPPAELRLAAAEGLARLGNAAGLDAAVAAAAAPAPPVRAQAAMVLGLLPRPEAARALVKLLDDPAEQVRLAAAAAVLRGGDEKP